MEKVKLERRWRYDTESSIIYFLFALLRPILSTFYPFNENSIINKIKNQFNSLEWREEKKGSVSWWNFQEISAANSIEARPRLETGRNWGNRAIDRKVGEVELIR